MRNFLRIVNPPKGYGFPLGFASLFFYCVARPERWTLCKLAYLTPARFARSAIMHGTWGGG